MIEIGLGHYLTLSAIIFAIGITGIFLNRKNVIIILMSIELILLAVNINLVSFSIYLQNLIGQVFAMFILTVAAAEAAVGLAIIVIYYKNRGYLATIGRFDAIVDFRWFTLKGKIGWIFWSIIHIYFLIGFRNRLIVFINWLWSYLTFSKGARLITDNK